jgi:hypothetical protein
VAYGELVEALFAHGFYGFAAGRVGGDRGDGFEAQRGDGGALESIVLLCGGHATDLSAVGVWGERRCGWEEVVCCEPVVIGELCLLVWKCRYCRENVPC